MKNRAAVLSVAAALVAFGTALPASAAPAPARAAAAVGSVRSGLDCTTWIHHNDPLYGGVDCTNNTGSPVTFHADIVCGWAPDVTGNSVTALPGRTEESSGHCAVYSSGIGHIGWTVE
ncbi:hypothetical protein K353_06495 [Kitasatospora sp. SolWspMP-SS2h]|uniref:hypothetical protein n=1 Tax=Kitasatospora sp. SolWspMP-SS2h TaxID=1305729 RepID=UPI000DBF6594|nr:hypothetical protein [Kitasatospora sp. SolWspMP-SS2h]RAJ30347.1 hypothetical protein K353_06495 [Kitasatospora sp. SolWspMP-SS2h]